MTLSAFFNSYPGMFVTQAFCHSVIASIICDQALRAWNIGEPTIRQRFRLIVVLIPIFSFPLYQAVNHDRSSVPFRLESLFDANRWMNMEIWGAIPVGLLFLTILAVTTLVFLFQEMIPVLMHALEAKHLEEETLQREVYPFVGSYAGTLSIAVPDVFVIEDTEPVIFSTTGKNPVIFVSNGLIKALTREQMEAAFAHELAHIARSRRPVLLAVFVLRILMFFNPVSLVEFRRAVRNEEKICDDIAVGLTHRPESLVEALKKFFPAPKTPAPDTGKKRLFVPPAPLEEYSHTLQLESRIARLTASIPEKNGERWFLFSLTILTIVVINYFIV